MTSGIKVFLCSRPTKCSTYQYTQLHAVEMEKMKTIKELIIIDSEKEEVVQCPKPGSNANNPIIVCKWEYLEDLNTEEIRNEILKDMMKEAATNENMIAFWIAVLGD